MTTNQIRQFVEKGAPVNAIQFDGSLELAEEIIDLISAPLRGELVPKGQFNHDYDNFYVSVQSYYSIQYVGPGDWVVQTASGEVRIMHNEDFRREHIALDTL